MGLFEHENKIHLPSSLPSPPPSSRLPPLSSVRRAQNEVLKKAVIQEQRKRAETEEALQTIAQKNSQLITRNEELEKRLRASSFEEKNDSQQPSLPDGGSTSTWMKKSFGNWMGAGDAKEEVVKLREALTSVKEELAAKV